MVRDSRIKTYDFWATDLTTVTGSKVDVYSLNPLNGKIQCVYYNAGDYPATGSLFIGVSGTGAEGDILVLTSGTATGHHLGEDWVLFPRATTVTTSAVPTSGAGNIDYVEIPINSNVRVVISGTALAGTYADRISIVYI